MPDHDLILTKANAPEVSDEAIEAMGKELGLVGLPEKMVRNLCALGVGIQERGLVKLANGVALVTTEMLVDTAQRIHKKLKHHNRTVEETRSLAYALGYVSRQAVQNVGSVVKQESIIDEVEKETDKRRRKSFVPHAVVGAAQNVQVINHNYPPGAQPPEEKSIAKGLKAP